MMGASVIWPFGHLHPPARRRQTRVGLLPVPACLPALARQCVWLPLLACRWCAQVCTARMHRHKPDPARSATLARAKTRGPPKLKLPSSSKVRRSVLRHGVLTRARHGVELLERIEQQVLIAKH